TMTEGFWRGVDRVEVLRLVSGAAAYFPASVVNAPSMRKNLVWVEHESLMVGGSKRMKEYVHPTRIRLSPPPFEISRSFVAGDEVDVFIDSEGFWVRGKVTANFGNSKYIVRVKGGDGTETEANRLNLRLHQWINGQWTSPNKEDPPLKKRKPCERAEKVFNKQWSSSSLYKEDPPLKKLKRCEIEEKVFSNGTMVEVRSDEQGYEGSWYTAKIISYLGENRYRVEYQTLTTEDLKELLKEEARGSDIRPNPPQSACDRYELKQPVDAWYNDGWWSGRVYKINSDYTRYVVYFETTDERFVFGYNDVRPCHV
ncbi:unnamed protein product, partial [Thlaspi arvense]